MARSLMFGAAKVGMDIALAAPAEYQVEGEYLELARSDAEAAGTSISLTEDPAEAADGASAV